jgi:hypothetical protein
MLDVKIDELHGARHLANPQVMERLLDDLGEMARSKWESAARVELDSTRQDYIRGIQPVQSEPGVRVVVLTGWLPNAVEHGQDPYDMRTTILHNPNSRIRRKSADGGWYASVPFRHKTPGTSDMAGAPMGSQHGPRGGAYQGDLHGGMTGAQSVKLGKSIHRAAMKLKESVTSHNAKGERTKTVWGGKKGRLPAGLAPKLHERHATDIFAGMARVRHVYQKSTDTQYMTWRTISTKNPEGWMHPGIQARHLSRQVAEHIQRQAPLLVARMVRAMEAGK